MIITTNGFIALLVNWYINRLLPLIRQFFLIPNRINEFMDYPLLRHEHFRTMISHQCPLRIMYDILTLTNSTLLTADMYQPRMIYEDECEAVGGMRIGKGN
jgi:hypothetical protein